MMRRNNFFNFNPYQYEKHLSPFGRQVLKTLIKIRERDRTRKPIDMFCAIAPQRYRYNHAQNRTITFGGTQSSVPNRAAGYFDFNNNDTEITDFRESDISVDDHKQWPCQSSSLTLLPSLPPPLPSLSPPLPSLPPPLPSLPPPLPSLPPPLPSLPPQLPSLPVPLPSLPPLPTLVPPSLPSLPSAPRLPGPPLCFTQRVPTSAELVFTANTIPTPVEDRLTRDDVITSVENQKIIDNSRNILDELYKSSDDEYLAFENTVHNTTNKIFESHQNKSDNVQWDDMFDTELIPEISTLNAEDVENINDEIIARDQSINDTRIETFDGNCKTNKNKINGNEVKKPKRMNQSKVTDVINKKVKKAGDKIAKAKQEARDALSAKVVKKNNFRKQKYTKTVTNWLNDVDPNNTVEEDEVSGGVEQLVPAASELNNQYPCETIQEKVSKSAKKVVQAQLTNKGGIMKFGKPAEPESVKDMAAGAAAEGGSSANKEVEKAKVKGKKTKPKFVAPIKSQSQPTIGDDIIYEVHTVEEAAIQDQHKQFLCSLVDQEIVTIVLYSNGFNQLNSQHTEDSCLPEGVMLHVDDTFYYLKGTGDNIGEILLKVLRDNTTLCFDGKALLMYYMDKFNLEIDTTLNIVDTKIAGCLLEPDAPPSNFSGVCAGGAACALSGGDARQAAARCCARLRGAAPHLRARLREHLLWDVFARIEMPLLPIVAEMERAGMCVDVGRLSDMERALMAAMRRTEAACHAAAGRSFQINSHLQVRALLYDELKLDSKLQLRVRETVTRGDKSTSEDVLRQLSGAHALPGLVLQYRRLHKTHATFVAGVAHHVRASTVTTCWEQVAAATGRMASSAPNLQAIPKAPFHLAPDTDGDEGNDGEGSRPSSPLLFRSVFVAGAGGVLLAADWQQVECRVFAAAAADESLAAALQASDLFQTLTALWLAKPVDAVSVCERERTKRLVYAALYGAGARKLCDILHVDYARARDVLASFYKTFPSLKKFGSSLCERVVSAGGRVRTLCGRCRRLPHIGGADAQARAHAERQALNYVVQGTAADVCKLAMVRCVRALRRRGLGARLLLQLHDELVWRVSGEELPRAARVIRRCMESAGRRAGLPRLPVALRAGADWGRMEPYAPPDEGTLSDEDDDL